MVKSIRVKKLGAGGNILLHKSTDVRHSDQRFVHGGVTAQVVSPLLREEADCERRCPGVTYFYIAGPVRVNEGSAELSSPKNA